MGRINPFCFCFSAFLVMCLFLPLAKSADLATDAQALLAFKEAIQSKDNSNKLASWNASTTGSVCTNWTGISCRNFSSTERVITVDLPDASLLGQITLSTLGSLNALQNLNLTSNEFSGELPASVFLSWPELVQIDVSFNNFNGSIPQSITNASLLQLVNLQNNSFSGQIPEINSPTLKTFNVSNNELEGQIPSSLSNFSPLSFSGNGKLCGIPLNATCDASTPSPAASPPTGSTPLPPASPPTAITGNHKSKLSDGAIVGIVIGAVLGGCLILVLFRFIADRRRKRNVRNLGARVNPGNSEGEAMSLQRDPSPPREQAARGEARLVFVGDGNRDAFDLESLLRASAEVMGVGSLGTAYKAMVETVLEHNLIVVVKRLNFKYKVEYRRHLDELATLRHQSLVPMKAWYFFENEKMVVYDYIHGNSLHALLHGDKPMEWEKRLRVAGMVANALAYMHERQVEHGDVKSANVLIDAQDKARVTDYGLVQLAVNLPLTPVRNTGYIAPEILNLSQATIKGDVYSFGVLLLEMLTGKSPSPAAAGGRPNGGAVIDLPQWVQSIVREEWTAEVFDLEIMKFEYIQEEMMQLLQIALTCVSPSPDQRPSMAELVRSIDSLRRSDDEESVGSL